MLVTYVSSALVLGLDALTYVFLAVLVVRTRLPESRHVDPVDQAAARGGLALLRSHPELLGLLTLTWFFNLLYGPVEVALPLHVTDNLHAQGTLLGSTGCCSASARCSAGSRPARCGSCRFGL